MNYDTLIDLAQSGILAPSADNQHVFKYELTTNSINLWPSPEFAATSERHRRILGLISLGAVVENIRLRAGQLGFASNTQWWPEHDGSDGMLARLTFEQSTQKEDELALAIPHRHTNRRMYHGPALSGIEMSQLKCEVNSSQGVQFVWLLGDARRRALKLIWRAESERFLRKSLHDEIFASIRFDLSWQQSAERALPPGALEIEAPMRPLFKALRHWPLMRALNRVGVHHLVGMRAGWLPCWQAPALAVLTTTEPLEPGAIAVGAALERVWLRATRLGLAMQPLAASVVLPLQNAADNGASECVRTALIKGWQGITSDSTPLMVFRIGRAEVPAIRSKRLPVSEYFLAEP